MIDNKSSCELCLDQCFKYYNDEKFESYALTYEGDIAAAIKKVDYACLTGIVEDIAFLLVEKGRIQELITKIPEIVKIVQETLYVLEQISPVESANITQITTNPNLGLNGKGVIVAMIDTGLDYLNKEFQYEDNTTRVVNIWDQSINTGKIPEGFYFGSEYSREDINSAIKLSENKGDPKTIVPSMDEIGHGTACAGIIGARGIDKNFQSAAKECEFIIVKLKEVRSDLLVRLGVERKDRHIYASSDIYLAVNYIIQKITKLLKPVVVFIPIGSTFGAHDGTDPLDVQIDTHSLKRGVVFVTGLGNQGDTETHVSGNFEKDEEKKTIELEVGKNQTSMSMQIWVKKPDKVSIEIVSPSGETSGKIPARVEDTTNIDFVFEGSTATVSYLIPEDKSGDELITIELRKLVPGIWVFQLYGDYIVTGRYDGWIMQRELLEEGTKFLNSDPLITLTRPSTSRLIITSGYYNQIDNSIVARSGRGYTRDGRVKPDVACGGINVVTTSISGGTTVVSGSSIAASVLVGAVTLLLQWGIVNGKDPKMVAIKIKNYLIRGTKKRIGDSYPNPELGYGLLDMVEVFNQIRVNVRGDIWGKEIFINIPEEIKYFIDK